MAKAMKIQAANIAVPQDRDGAAAALRAIGEINRQIGRLQADMNDEIAATKARFETQAEPLRQVLADTTQGLAMWAEANRKTLTGGDKTKTVDLGTGLIRWRLRPPSVRLIKEAEILERLRAMGLARFIRVKEEVSREALLADPETARTVPGVSIGSAGEEFIPEPFEAELSAGEAA